MLAAAQGHMLVLLLRVEEGLLVTVAAAVAAVVGMHMPVKASTMIWRS